MLIWGFSVNQLFIGATLSPSRIIGGVFVIVILLLIAFFILRSLGLDQSTPPQMVFRKLWMFCTGWIHTLQFSSRMKRADSLEEAGQFPEALALYLKQFSADGMVSTSPKTAMNNDAVLERLEDLCLRLQFDFPSDSINRLREDIYDYFQVKQKHLDVANYDNTPLIRAANEERFKNKLNLSQEFALAQSVSQLMVSFGNQLNAHIARGVQPLSREEVEKKKQIELRDTEASPFAGGANITAASASFGAAASIEAPAGNLFGAMGQQSTSPEVSAGASLESMPGFQSSPPAAAFQSSPPASDAFATAPSSSPEVPGLFGGVMQAEPSLSVPEQPVNPFSLDDPGAPFHDLTGTIRKLPGESEDQNPSLDPVVRPSQPVANDDPFSKLLEGKQSQEAAPQQQTPAVTAGFPGANELGSPSAPTPQMTGAFPGFGAPATGPSAPQPMGGFPGFGTPAGHAAAPQMTGAFPGFGAPATGPSAPQPTGGFPGFGAPTADFGAPATGPSTPQPTGGFPGFGTPAGHAAAPQMTGAFPGFGAPAAGPSAPQPTGGFPGFGMPASGAPATGFGVGPSAPQPTGGFPGFGAPAISANGTPATPQITGGFPGFGAPATGPSAPQPTGGFPGFGTPTTDEKKDEP